MAIRSSRMNLFLDRAACVELVFRSVSGLGRQDCGSLCCWAISMRLSILITFLAACVLLSVASAFGAEPSFDAPEPVARRLERKTSSVFYRPAKSTSAEQIAYADSLRDANRLRSASKQYSALVHTWHESPEAPMAQRELAALLEKRGKYQAAFAEYRYLIENYASSFTYSDILDRQFRIANQIMNEEVGVLGWFGESTPREAALPLLEQIVASGPRWERAPEAQFSVGWIHENKGDYELAISAYDIVQQEYPRSDFAASASFRMGTCLYHLAKASRHDEKSAQRARSQLNLFLRDYPDHESAADAQKYVTELTSRLADQYYQRAVFYDLKAKRPTAALIAYTDFLNKFKASENAETAAQRIRELKAELGVQD
ncbi:MAG: outer membrane protein assembly factor BamD [Lentisphaerales bacterium]|nr:MAG: outer membrane protein assembly factor BamD [Lentisphaerales bacterium]